MNLLQHLSLCYDEAVKRGQKYATYDNDFSYYRNDEGEFVLHELNSFSYILKDTVSIPLFFTYMDSGALEQFRDSLVSVNLCNVKRIEDDTFSGYRKLLYVEGHKVLSIGKNAFYGVRLKALILYSIKEIHSYAFTVLKSGNMYYLDLPDLYLCCFSHASLSHKATRLYDIRKLYDRYYNKVLPKTAREKSKLDYVGFGYKEITEDILKVF